MVEILKGLCGSKSPMHMNPEAQAGNRQIQDFWSDWIDAGCVLQWAGHWSGQTEGCSPPVSEWHGVCTHSDWVWLAQGSRDNQEEVQPASLWLLAGHTHPKEAATGKGEGGDLEQWLVESVGCWHIW